MKTLGEIRRNILSFYSTIQDKITDFSVGSVVNSLIYSFSSALETAYVELEEVQKQAYISTATGEYLDKLIEGTFQLPRSQDTRATGYVVVYAESPITNFSNVQLRYADYDYNSGEFIAGTQGSTKFIGYNVQGDEGIVYSLIQPKNSLVLDSNNRYIVLDRPVQYLILPVASLNKGSAVNVREGGIYSFPSPPPGISGVLNTSNPGAVFFSSNEAGGGSPFYSRFTEVLGYDNTNNVLSVLNAYNFSSQGFIEFTSDISRNKNIIATYSEFPGGAGTTMTAGLVFEYIDSSTNSITLKLPIENSLDELPKLQVRTGGSTKTLTLDSFTYDGNTYTNPYDGTFDTTLRSFIENFSDGLLVQQRTTQINPDLIFDPDGVLTEDYKIPDSLLVTGASDADSDEEYREALVKYLAGLSRATKSALEAGALQVPGVSFARTLPKHLAPRGTVLVLAAGEDGYLTPAMKSEIKTRLSDDWKAAGVEVLVKAPQTIPTNLTVTIRLEEGVFKDSVTEQVRITFNEYLKSRDPGDSLRYSDVLQSISDIGGVLNVFNLLLTKKLSDDTFKEYKANYGEAVLLKAATSGIIEVNHDAHGLTDADNGTFISYDPDLAEVTQEIDPSNADGILYAVADTDNVEILLGDPMLLNGLYTQLTNADLDSAEAFQAIIENASIFADENEKLFFLSYVLAEPLDDDVPSHMYPVDIDNINYKYIKDYTASYVEIFRQNTITLGTNVVPMVGIRYI